ncbi:MAG: TolC family protein, partial [Tannerella sp.]|nr:TolC family protein [Tannerella sp.]
MKRYLLTVIVPAVSCVAVCAQELYTLEKCIGIGLERNYSIRIIQNEEQISSNNATPGNAGYLPVVDLSGGFSGTRYGYNYDYSDGTSGKED